jgi:hypothetical protein
MPLNSNAQAPSIPLHFFMLTLDHCAFEAVLMWQDAPPTQARKRAIVGRQISMRAKKDARRFCSNHKETAGL